MELSEKEMRSVRGQRISMVMQDPKFSLNPVMTIGDQIIEAYRLHNSVSKSEAYAKVGRNAGGGFDPRSRAGHARLSA